MYSSEYMFNSVRHKNVEAPLHLHGHMEAVLIDDGVLNIKIADVDYSLCKGQGIFLPPFTPHQFISQVDNSCHVMMFSGVLSSYFKLTNSFEIQNPVFDISDEALYIVNKILPDKDNRVSIYEAQAVMAPLFIDIYNKCTFKSHENVDADAFETAFEYIHNHFKEAIDLGDVAAKAGIHPVTLSKLFKNRTMMNFNAYIRHLRCSFAAEQLRNGDAPITEIAFIAGFGCIRSFNRAFISIYGITPSDYREMVDKGCIL